TGCFQALVELGCGQRRQQAEDGETRGPSANLFECALGDGGGVVVHAEDKRSNRVNVAFGEALEHGGVLTGLVESLVDVFEIDGVDGFHADEDPLASRSGDQVAEFLVAQEIGADLGHPVDLGFGCDDVAQQRLGAFQINGEIVVDEKNCHLAFFAAGAGLQQEEFIDYALVGAEADGVAEESSHGAELAAVGTASSGLDGNNTKCAPAFADLFEQRVRGFRYEIELV